MARGSQAKEEITQKILETFESSFINDKEIRIPVEENGEIIQIKVTLTAAKVNVENNAGGAISNAAVEQAPPQKVEVTEEEKQNVQKLMENLGL